MKDMYITVQIAQPLKAKLEALARSEDRTLERQTLWLIEDVLRFFEGGTDVAGFGYKRDRLSG